jgi:hypothetical protein
MATPVHLVSPLLPRHCVERLRAALKLSCSREPTLEGKVTDDSARLWKVVFLRNSFQPYLRGEWQPLPDGTAFRGSVGMHPIVNVFLVVWYCLTGVIGGGMWVSVIQVWASGVAHSDPHHASNAGGFLLCFPLGFWLFPILLVWFGRWLARGQDALLVAFLAEAIRGHQVPPTGPGHRTAGSVGAKPAVPPADG